MTTKMPIRLGVRSLTKAVGAMLYAYIFLGFMVIPCFNTLTSIFRTVKRFLQILQ